MRPSSVNEKVNDGLLLIKFWLFLKRSQMPVDTKHFIISISPSASSYVRSKWRLTPEVVTTNPEEQQVKQISPLRHICIDYYRNHASASTYMVMHVGEFIAFLQVMPVILRF